MKSTIYYLSTCDTCKRILKEVDPPSSVHLQDIKVDPISEEALSYARTKVDSYKELLNKRARIYRAKDLKNQNLSDEQMKSLILEEYTLLKRPLAIIDGEVYAGNSKKTVASLKVALS